MAYIRKLPSGKWQATVRRPDGKKVTTTSTLKSVVKEWATEQESAFTRFRKATTVMVASADGTPGGERPWRGVARERRDGFNPHGFFVYFLWGDDPGCPVYIGKSANVMGRIGDHVHNMGHLVETVTLLRCESAQHMSDIETWMIAFYKPRLNCVGVRLVPPVPRYPRQEEAG